MNVSTSTLAVILSGWQTATIIGAFCFALLVALYFARKNGWTNATFSLLGIKAKIESKIPPAIVLEGTTVRESTIIHERTGRSVASKTMDTGSLEITTTNGEHSRPK